MKKNIGNWILGIGLLVMIVSCKPKEEVRLRQIRNVVIDVSKDNEPVLRAEAILYNPNKVRMKLKKIDIEILVNEKSSGLIDQKLKTKVPARSEFSVPLEVKLNLKEGFFDNLFSILGGRKTRVQYKGTIRLSYNGVPINVPVDYSDEIRLRF